MLKPEHLAEIRRLRDQSIALLDVLARVEPSFAGTARALRQIIEDSAVEQDLRGLREAARDLRGTLIAVPADRRGEVLGHVRRASGFPLEAEERKDAAAAHRILQRGRIRNDHEYYLLRSYLDALEATGDATGSYAGVAALLHAYRARSADAV